MLPGRTPVGRAPVGRAQSPAAVALQFFVGEFDLDTTGAGGIQHVAGVGFQPKVLVFFTAALTSANGFGGHYNRCVGFAVDANGEESQNAYNYNVNAKTGNNSARAQSQSILRLARNSDDNAGEEFSIRSYNSDGFSLNKETVGSARNIKFIAMAGDDLQAKVLSIATATSTGVTSHTGAGFEPEAVIGVAGFIPTATGYDTRYLAETYSWGVATSSTSRWALGTSTDRDNPNQSNRILDSTSFLYAPYEDAEFIKMDLDAFTSDGLDINYETTDAAARRVTLLLLRGAGFAVGDGSARTTAGSQDVTTTGVNPALVMMASVNSTTKDSIINGNGQFNFGAASSSTQRASVWDANEDASTTNHMSSRVHADDECLQEYDENSTAPIARRQADLNSFGTETMQFQWSVQTALASRYGWFVAGETVAASATNPPRLALMGVGI